MSVTSFLFLALIALFTYVALSIRKQFSYWQLRGVPCDDPELLMGNVTGIYKTRSFTEVWLSYYRKFRGSGPFAGFYWFQRPAAFLLDIELIKNVLIKDFHKFTDRGFFTNEVDDPLSGHLFLLEGHKWRNMRNKLSPTFTSRKMKLMFPMIVNIGKEFAKVFEQMCNADPIVEVKDVLARYTIDVIGSCAFGIECSSLNDPNVEFRIMGRKAVVDTRYGKAGLAFLNSFPDLSRKLHMKMTPEDVEKFFMTVIRETVAFRENSNVRRNDFLDMLIDLKNNKCMKTENGEELTNLTLEEVAAQAYVFLVAGFETSSTTMGFALYELAQHQDIQKRAREEVNSVLAGRNGSFSYECVKEMVYLDHIISETLRLYTIVPVLNRIALEDYQVPDHPKYVIKKGMPVLIPACAIHRDPAFYPNPDVFNPDNFEPAAVKQRDSIEWLPFGDGPRNCIGMRFGQMQTRIGLAILLQHFNFSVCSKTQIPMQLDKKSFLLSSEEGIYLRVEKIVSL